MPVRTRPTWPIAALALLLLATAARAQTTAPLVGVRISPDSVRRAMAIPSGAGVRGRVDTTYYTRDADEMAAVWRLGATATGLDSLGPAPAPGVAGIICPHDDFTFAARVDRRVIPLLTARTVVVIGVFHGYWRLGVRDRMVFDDYRAWRASDGPVPVSPLREALLARLPRDAWAQDSLAHDMEHSIEPLVCWLRHQRPDLEIVPILTPAADFERMRTLGHALGDALAAAMAERGWTLGRDVAIAISADAIHYGPDFSQRTFGEGGPEAYRKATDKDRGLLTGPLRGRIDETRIRELYDTFVDPDRPDTYRWTWCGRFSIPLGLFALERLGRDHGGVSGWPLAYATSISGPHIGFRDAESAPSAPTNLYHFVGYPGVAFTLGDAAR